MMPDLKLTGLCIQMQHVMPLLQIDASVDALCIVPSFAALVEYTFPISIFTSISELED